MNYDEYKLQIGMKIDKLIEIVTSIVPDSISLKDLQVLKKDIIEDFNSVVVLGEFKRGKSTLVNALVGESILPIDVTPTTATINVLLYDAERSLIVQRVDGTNETVDLTSDHLQEYIVDRISAPDQIQYLLLTLPSPFLQNRLFLIDTPGVNDLNEQRAEVTYRFIPRSDIVLFLLDATQPLTKTEIEFLEYHLLKNGLDQILFLVNFADQVDEEEIDELMEYITSRLEKVLPNLSFRVLLFSGKQAIQAVEQSDDVLLKQSGFSNVQEAIKQLIDSGSQAKGKAERYNRRFLHLSESLQRELQTAENLSLAVSNDLEKMLDQIENVISRYEEIKIRIAEYVQDREQEFRIILHKSYAYFMDQLKEDVIMEVSNYTGTNFKEFIERQLPMSIKKRIKIWIENYVGHIQYLFELLDKELSVGLAMEFQTSVMPLGIQNKGLGSIGDGNELLLSAQDISNAPLLAGVLAGGAGALMMLLGGPLFLPLIGMAGFPFLQKEIVNHQLTKAKETLLPELKQILDKTLDELLTHLEDYVHSHVVQIQHMCQNRFELLSYETKERVQRELELKEDEYSEVTGRRQKISDAMKRVVELTEEPHPLVEESVSVGNK